MATAVLAKCISLAWKIFVFCETAVQMLVTTPLSLAQTLLRPYSLGDLPNYCLAYVFRCFTLCCVGNNGIARDLIATGCTWQLCGQFDVLERRLVEITGEVAVESSALPSQKKSNERERQLVKDCLLRRTHGPFNTADEITDVFGVCIVFEVYMDAMATCLNVYKLSTAKFDYYQLFSKLFELSLILTRLFLNCYFGNELAAQSENFGNGIYLTNWSLSFVTRKDLSMMIIRSSKPITISNKAFIELMLAFFVKVVKISYSGYNLLVSTV